MKNLKTLIFASSAAIVLGACSTMTPAPITQKLPNDTAVATPVDPEGDISIEPPVRFDSGNAQSSTPLSGISSRDIIKKYGLGTKRDLICRKPFNAVGQLADRPNMQVAVENFPDMPAEEVWKLIGGFVELNGNLPYGQGRWENACTVRISYAFNKVGNPYKIPNSSKTVSGLNGDQYLYRVKDLENYLRAHWGRPDLEMRSGENRVITMPAEPGILILNYGVAGNSFAGHVVFWDGQKTTDGTFDTTGYTESGVHIANMDVVFYKLPCFQPAERLSKTVNQPQVPRNR